MVIDKGIISAMKEHKDKLSHPHFLFSAENPMHPEKDTIKLNHNQVLGHLQNSGYDAHEVNGHYGAPERSIIVYNVKPKEAEALHGLAHRMGQDSSIYSNGLAHEMRYHHGDKAGMSAHGEGTQHHVVKPKDFYTTLPGGQHFTHNFDFNKLKPTNMPRDAQEKTKLINDLEKGALRNFMTGAAALGMAALGSAPAHASSKDFHDYLSSMHGANAKVTSHFHPIAQGSKHGGGSYEVNIGPYSIRGTHHTLNGGDQSHNVKMSVKRNADPAEKTAHEADAKAMFNHIGQVAPKLMAKSEELSFHYNFDLLRAEDPEAYAKLAREGVALLHPVRIAGSTHRPDNGIQYHSTIKFFDPSKDNQEEIHNIASKLPMRAPDPRKTFITPKVFKDRLGNDVYAIAMHGEHADEMKSHNKAFDHMGHKMNYDFQPHISVDHDTYKKIVNSKAKTAHEAGIEFGDAELKQGHNKIHSYSSKLAASESYEQGLSKSEDKPMNLVHFSHRSDLSHVDPAFKGTGVDAGVKGRDTEHPHSFYYKEGAEPEKLVTQGSKHKYVASVDQKEHPVYDFASDHLKINDQVLRENQGAHNMDMVHQKLKAAGYHGFTNSSHPHWSGVVAMYHKLPVKKV